MKDLEMSMHESAVSKELNREIINLSYDAKADVYRAYVEFGYIKTYLYVPAKGLSEAQVCRILLSLMVVYHNGGDIDKVLQDLIDEQIGKEEKKGAEAKAEVKPAPKKRAARKPEPKEEETKPSEEQADSVEEEKAPAKKTRKKVTKAKVEKTIAYDRTQVEHKKEMARVLNSNFPGWNTNKELMVKAKETSEALEGVALFDSKGAVMPTFAENVIELMNGSDEEEEIDL